MRVVIFDTPELQEQGLQFLEQIEDDTLFVFPLVTHGARFHSRNVPQSFDLAFLTDDFVVIDRFTVKPPHGIALAPNGTYMAVEAKAGNLSRWGFTPGRRVDF